MYLQGESNSIGYVAQEEVPMANVNFYLLAPFPLKLVISRGSGPGRLLPLGPLHVWSYLLQLGGALGHLGQGFRLVFLGGEVWLRILMEEWLVILLYVWEVV